MITGRDRERGEAVADELDGTFVAADLTDPDGCRAHHARLP